MKKAYVKPLAKKTQALQSVTAVSKCLPTSLGKVCLPTNGLGNGISPSI